MRHLHDVNTHPRPSGRPRPAPNRVIVLPDATIEGGPGKEDLCHVCVRVVLPADHKWTWLACDTCRIIDAAIASELGGRRFLPLGRHSIMNGTSVAAAASPLLARAQLDGLVAEVGSWQTLWTWKREEAARIAADNDLPNTGRISWGNWTFAAPASPTASRDAYLRLIRRHHYWLLAEPNVKAHLTEHPAT